MTKRIPNLAAYAEGELEEALAHLLAQARGEVLSDAEAQQFQQLCQEIEWRRAPTVTAA